jgi:branched-subunit amino acid ABC-type transport system permease component
MVKYAPELLKITILLFVPPFPGDPYNTALTLIIATNVCVIGIIFGLTVKRVIGQRVRARKVVQRQLISTIGLDSLCSEGRIIY